MLENRAESHTSGARFVRQPAADQNLCPKRQHCKLDWILHATLLLTKTQKSQLTKTLAEKKNFANQNHKRPERKFWRNWLWRKTDKANEAETILQTQLTITFAEKRQANFENLHNQPRTKPKPRNKANQNQSWPKRKPKTLKSVLATRQKQPETLLMKRKLVERKSQTWKPADWKTDSNTIWKNAAAKNWFWISEPTQKRNLLIKDVFGFCSWVA